MLMKIRSLFVLVFLLFVAANVVFSQDTLDTLKSRDTLNPVENTARHLVIGVKHTPPFVNLEEGNKPYGLSVTLWENIIKNTNHTFEYKSYETLVDVIEAVAKGEVDLSINPVTVTGDRYEKVNFSQPFYVTNTAFAKRNESAFWKFLKNLFSWGFIAAVGLLFLLLFISGLLVWYVEHKKNDDFSGSPAQGIGHGFWWSAVTMTTVGYGDKAPKTFWGRFIGFIWMFTAVIVISSVTASIASSLTVNSIDGEIKSVRDLRDKKVGTVASSSPERFLGIYNVKSTKYATPTEGLEALKAGEIDFFVYDRPVMNYILKSNEEESDLIIAEKQLKTDYYSFTFPKDEKLLMDEVNAILIDELNNIEWIMEIEQLSN